MENTNLGRPLAVHVCGYDFQAGSEYVSLPHSHAFCQMNLMVSGSGEFETSLWKQPLRPGDVVFIPPGAAHMLRPSPDGDFCCYSFKFSIDCESFGMPSHPVVTEPELRERQLEWVRALGQVFSSIAPPELFRRHQEFPLSPDLPGIEVLEGMLLGFCRFIGAAENSPDSPVLRKVKGLVQSRRGKAVAVTECAEYLKCSAGHLLTLLRRETGMSVKEIIDRERIAIAKRFLAYSDISIRQLADRMEFNDLVYFCKFFKKYTCVTPRDYRKRRKYAENPK